MVMGAEEHYTLIRSAVKLSQETFRVLCGQGVGKGYGAAITRGKKTENACRCTENESLAGEVSTLPCPSTE